MKEWYELGPFTVFDIETTGMSAVNDRIVEIAALRVDRDAATRRFHSMVDPERPIPYAATRIHHISDDMVADAPAFSRIAPDFLAFAQGSILVAHNARFDLSFLQESLARCGMPLWRGDTLDSLKLIRKTHPGMPSYSLQNLRRLLALKDSVDNMQPHRSAADVEWTAQILRISLTSLLRRPGANP